MDKGFSQLQIWVRPQIPNESRCICDVALPTRCSGVDLPPSKNEKKRMNANECLGGPPEIYHSWLRELPRASRRHEGGSEIQVKTAVLNYIIHEKQDDVPVRVTYEGHVPGWGGAHQSSALVMQCCRSTKTHSE